MMRSLEERLEVDGNFHPGAGGEAHIRDQEVNTAVSIEKPF